MSERYLAVNEVCDRLGYSAGTVRRMVKEGRLHAIRPGGPRSHFRIPETEIMKLEERCEAEVKAASMQYVFRRRAEEKGLIAQGQKSTGRLSDDILASVLNG